MHRQGKNPYVSLRLLPPKRTENQINTHERGKTSETENLPMAARPTPVIYGPSSRKLVRLLNGLDVAAEMCEQ